MKIQMNNHPMENQAPPPNKSLERLAHLLDEQFTIPGTQIKFGWDGIIGLIPGIGDILTSIASLLLILAAHRYTQSASVTLRMLVNVLIENIFGAIPILGNIFDIAWKANTKNVRLLERYQAAPKKTQRHSAVAVAAAVLFFLFTAACCVLIPILVLIWLINTFGLGSV